MGRPVTKPRKKTRILGWQGLFCCRRDLRGVGFDGGIEARQDSAVGTNQEFGEIPADFAAGLRILAFVGEELIERRDIAALHGNDIMGNET